MPDVTSHTPPTQPPVQQPTHKSALPRRSARVKAAATAASAPEPTSASAAQALTARASARPSAEAANGRGLETREQLKRVALKLFADRGVGGVSVRDILAVAGQRSGGALHYHFGGKDGLLRELIADAARVFDEARLAKLAALKQSGIPPTLREVLRVLADPFEGDTQAKRVPLGYGALLNALQVEHYEAFTAGVEGLDVGYRECIRLLRELLPDVPRATLNQRIRLMMLLLFSASSARERGAQGNGLTASVWQQFWADPSSKDTLLDCLEGMLSQHGH